MKKTAKYAFLVVTILSYLKGNLTKVRRSNDAANRLRADALQVIQFMENIVHSSLTCEIGSWITSSIIKTVNGISIRAIHKSANVNDKMKIIDGFSRRLALDTTATKTITFTNDATIARKMSKTLRYKCVISL